MNKPKVEEDKHITPIEEIIPDGNASLVEKTTILDEIDESDLDEFIPKISLSVPSPDEVSVPENQAPCLISDEKYVGILDEIVGNIREDRKQVSEYIDNLADMVINDGDSTTSSKEALVNLVKIKTDLQDKMLKAADLMTRLKLKNSYAYSGPHMNVMQQNNINTDQDFNKKELIKHLNMAQKKKEKDRK